MATVAADTVAIVAFESYARSVPEALDCIDAAETLARQERIILKPNLVNADPHPVTTPAACCEAVLDYCRAHSDADVAIAEGSGGIDTADAYDQLGYGDLACRKDVRLIDLDQEPTVRLEDPSHKLLREFYLPECLQDAFVVSIPVLKAHSMSEVTLTMKNLFGIAPAGRYAGPGFRKAKLHGRNNGELHRYVFELNRFRAPDLSLIDASIGMAEAHLWGPPCDPPVSKLVAGHDPVAVDAAGARLLGVDWRDVGHIALADGVLGHAR
ncbi:MAG: DUF362 domain-containing protein [bacterium]|nr:DUF362 domain-containing protein [bacterium]